MEYKSRGVKIIINDAHKKELEKQVVAGAREFTIGTVLFHHAVGEILGVNVTDMECLALIIYKGLATPSGIAEYTGLSSGATTAMLDRLEKARLIERRPNPQDRRGTLVVLTRGATERLGALFGSLQEAGVKLAASYSAEELELLSNFFHRLTILWKQEREKLSGHMASKQ